MLEVILTVARTGRASGSQTVTDVESNILATGLQVLHEHTADAAVPPVIADLRDLISQGPDLRARPPCSTHPMMTTRTGRRTRPAPPACTASPTRAAGSAGCSAEQTTEHIDLSRPVDYDISAPAQSGTRSWPRRWPPHGRARSRRRRRTDALADAGLESARNHVIIMDEMHRALRASPG